MDHLQAITWGKVGGGQGTLMMQGHARGTDSDPCPLRITRDRSTGLADAT